MGDFQPFRLQWINIINNVNTVNIVKYLNIVNIVNFVNFVNIFRIVYNLHIFNSVSTMRQNCGLKTIQKSKNSAYNTL